jgi:hypothetical protein
VSGTKRQANDWYSPYFAPTTVFVAVTVLIVSIQAGKYVGNYYVARDRAATLALPVANTATVVHMPTKSTVRGTQIKPRPSTSSKTPH